MSCIPHVEERALVCTICLDMVRPGSTRLPGHNTRHAQDVSNVSVLRRSPVVLTVSPVDCLK
jgi:hypothetical protein